MVGQVQLHNISKGLHENGNRVTFITGGHGVKDRDGIKIEYISNATSLGIVFINFLKIIEK